MRQHHATRSAFPSDGSALSESEPASCDPSAFASDASPCRTVSIMSESKKHEWPWRVESASHSAMSRGSVSITVSEGNARGALCARDEIITLANGQYAALAYVTRRRSDASEPPTSVPRLELARN